MSELLRVEGLHIAVEGKEILKGLDLTINTGETHVIMGSNGAGKPTLFNAIMGKYKRGVMFFIHHRWMVWASLVATIVLLVWLMKTTKTGLVPQEDQGGIMVNVSTSPGNTLTETVQIMDKVEAILKETPEIEDAQAFI